MPTVRMLGELTDTALRQFPISTVLQLTCEGQIGNDASKVRAEKSCIWRLKGFAKINIVEIYVLGFPNPF